MLRKIFNFLIRVSGLLESIILFSLGVYYCTNNNYLYLILCVIGVWWAYRWFKHIFKVFSSKEKIIQDSRNFRVVVFEGPQRRGKTSCALYCASVLNKNGSPIFSNVPFKIHGNYVNVLNHDIIQLKERLPDNSCGVMDEITLLYHNLDKINCYDFELFLQLIGHFIDGNFYMCSVKASRLPQQIKEKVSGCFYMLGQRTINTSLILAKILQTIGNKFFDLKLSIGLRCWAYQVFEEINHENYNFDLSNVETNSSTKIKNFAEIVEIYAFNDVETFEYNDRFFKPLYDKLPLTDLKVFDTLQIDYETLQMTGYKKLVDYFKLKYANLPKGAN